MTQQGGFGKGMLKKVFGSNGKEGEKKKDRNEHKAPHTAVSDPPINRQYGLKVAAPGTNPTIDIVAIHGLNGHRDETWTADNGVNWLADVEMLPKKIPNARIFVWGYDADTHRKDYLSEAYLHQHGSQLVGELSDERRLDGTDKRPIIFIGHSLGGIVIKSALIHSYGANSSHLVKHRAIKVSTYGIMFMGTPHSGGKGVNLGLLAVNIASIFVQTNDKVLKHLKEQSEWLSQQKSQYAPICEDFDTKFGWEVYPTPILGGLNSLVVVPDWSAIGWEHNAEPVQIMANHLNMVKFSGEEDPEYTKVWKKLVIMAREAEAKVDTNWAVEEGRMIVVNLALSKPLSGEERLELVSRLTYAAADMRDNEPGEKIHLTAGEPDILYDENGDFYKAKSEQTLVGPGFCIEENETMREYQEELLKIADLYERKVGDKDDSLSTGIIMSAQHDWEDVLNETEMVRKKYTPREGSNSIPKLENGLRTFETAQSSVRQWLHLLPTTAPCASRLCGGLRMILMIIWRSKMLSARTYDALEQIPLTISRAHGLKSEYDRTTLVEHVVQLYCAIVDMLRHILRAYSRIVVKEQQVHFKENSDDPELIRRFQRLIVLEKKVVQDRHVRLGALNTLKATGDKQWGAILAILNEQLTGARDHHALDNQDESKSRTIKASVNAELFKALGYDHSQCHQDIKEIMRHRYLFSALEKSRVSWLIDHERLENWITSPTSDLFLINGNEHRHEYTSPVSVYCGMLTRALQSQAPRIVLYWYCGLNANEDIVGMLGNVIGQLLEKIETGSSARKSIKKVWYADFVPDDQAVLFGLFRKILKQQLKTASVFCILDGVSFYEDNHRAQSFGELVEDLATIVGEAQKSRFIFKVLLTSPSRSEFAESAANAITYGSIEVLDMPNFVHNESTDLRELDIINVVTRRNSIASAGDHSVYEEAMEYLEDPW